MLPPIRGRDVDKRFSALIVVLLAVLCCFANAEPVSELVNMVVVVTPTPTNATDEGHASVAIGEPGVLIPVPTCGNCPRVPDGEKNIEGVALQSNDDGMPVTTIIVAAVIGSVALIALVAGVVVVLRRRGRTFEEEVNGRGELHAPNGVCITVSGEEQDSAADVGVVELGAEIAAGNATAAFQPLPQLPPPYAASIGVFGGEEWATRGASESRPPLSSRDVGIAAIDEAFVAQEAEANSAGFSAPLRCARGHSIEKRVTVMCAHPGKRPRKATDLRTLFDYNWGHVWTCALCARTTATNKTEHRTAAIAASREVTLTVDGAAVTNAVIPNVAVAVYDCIATQLAIADDLLRSRCTCGAQATSAGPHKIGVVINMTLVS